MQIPFETVFDTAHLGEVFGEILRRLSVRVGTGPLPSECPDASTLMPRRAAALNADISLSSKAPLRCRCSACNGLSPALIPVDVAREDNGIEEQLAVLQHIPALSGLVLVHLEIEEILDRAEPCCFDGEVHARRRFHGYVVRLPLRLAGGEPCKHP